jgi:hypothetical protein
MARIRVLDPTAAPPEVDPDPGPDAGPLSGRIVGIRYDSAWRSWEWAIDEWRQALEAAGIEVKLWLAGNRVGDEGERTFAELEQFADSVDIAVVGLGN